MNNISSKLGWYGKVVLTLICLCFVASGYAAVQTVREIAERSFPSVVMLLMEDANNQPTALASGFFVRENIIATSLHVVRGSTQGYIKRVGEEAKYDIIGIVGVDSEMDLVLLEIDNAKGQPLPFGNSQQVAVGDTVYAIGNPQGLEGTFSQGIISGVRNFNAKYILQITAAISPGSSGGPVLNSEGRVIGVAVATLREGQNLNFAVPAYYLSRLLTKLESRSPLSSLPSSPREDTLSEYLGEDTADAVMGENFLWSSPRSVGGDRSFYTFSLRNKLRNDIYNVYCIVIFYDEYNRPIDVNEVYYQESIRAGLAKRISGVVDSSVKELTTKWPSSTPKTFTLEIRVLGFEIVQ